METDILIAGLMVLASIVALLAIIVKVGRAIHAEPRQKAKAPASEPSRVLRTASAGW